MATPSYLESAAAFTTTTTTTNTSFTGADCTGATAQAAEAPPSSLLVTLLSSPLPPVLPSICSNDNISASKIINNDNRKSSNDCLDDNDNTLRHSGLFMKNEIDQILNVARNVPNSIHPVAFSGTEMTDNNNNNNNTNNDDDNDEDDIPSQSAASHVLHNSSSEPENLAEPWAAKQTRTVRQGKRLVLSVLLLSTIAMALSVYLYLSRTEHAEFHGRFHEYADKVLQSLGQSVDGTMGAVDSLMVGMVVSVGNCQLQNFLPVPIFLSPCVVGSLALFCFSADFLHTLYCVLLLNTVHCTCDQSNVAFCYHSGLLHSGFQNTYLVKSSVYECVPCGIVRPTNRLGRIYTRSSRLGRGKY